MEENEEERDGDDIVGRFRERARNNGSDVEEKMSRVE